MLRLFSRLPSLGAVRLSAYGFAVSIALAIAATCSVYADAKEVALLAGRQLAGLAELTEGAEVVWVNGERFHHSSLVVDVPLEQVLDRFETHCASEPNFVGKSLLEVPDEHFQKVGGEPPDPTVRHGIVRSERDGFGMIVCFVDPRPSGLSEYTERLERFLRTQNLGEFGRFRYAYAERTDSGKTHVVTLWADTDLNLKTMFPPTGDAAGMDPRVAPRPPQARRTFSAGAEGLDYGLWLFESGVDPNVTRRFYDDWARAQGWQIIEPPKAELGRAYLRADGFQTFVSIRVDKSRTHVSLIEAGRPEGGSIATIHVTE